MPSNPGLRRLSRHDELADIASYKKKLTPEQYQWLLDHYIKPEIRQDFRSFPEISQEDKRRIGRRHKARRRDAFEHPAQDGASPLIHALESVPAFEASPDLGLDIQKIINQK